MDISTEHDDVNHRVVTNARLKALIVVESRHGSTRDIAGGLGQRLVSHGFQTTVAEPNEHDEIDADVVVIGSAVYYGKWMKHAVRFVDRHADQLSTLPVWLFSSGPLVAGPALGDGIDEVYIDSLIERSHARNHRVFAGRLDQASLGPVEALIAHAVHAPEGDFRDWSAVAELADEIAATRSGTERAGARDEFAGDDLCLSPPSRS